MMRHGLSTVNVKSTDIYFGCFILRSLFFSALFYEKYYGSWLTHRHGLFLLAGVYRLKISPQAIEAESVVEGVNEGTPEDLLEIRR